MPTPIRRILDTWIANLNRGDLDAVVGLYAPDAVLLATFEPVPARTPDAIGAYFEFLGGKTNLEVTLDEASVSEHGPAIAGIYTFSYDDGPERLHTPSRFTLVMDPGQVRPILHHHSSQLP